MAPLYFETNGYSAALGEQNYAARGRAATDSREDKLSTVKAQLGPHFIINLFSAQSLKCHCCFFRYQGEYKRNIFGGRNVQENETKMKKNGGKQG